MVGSPEPSLKCETCGKPARRAPLVVQTTDLCQKHEREFHEMMAHVG